MILWTILRGGGSTFQKVFCVQKLNYCCFQLQVLWRCSVFQALLNHQLKKPLQNCSLRLRLGELQYRWCDLASVSTFTDLFQFSSLASSWKTKGRSSCSCYSCCPCCKQAMKRPRQNTWSWSQMCCHTPSKTGSTLRRAGSFSLIPSSIRPSRKRSAPSSECGWATWKSASPTTSPTRAPPPPTQFTMVSRPPSRLSPRLTLRKDSTIFLAQLLQAPASPQATAGTTMDMPPISGRTAVLCPVVGLGMVGRGVQTSMAIRAFVQQTVMQGHSACTTIRMDTCLCTPLHQHLPSLRLWQLPSHRVSKQHVSRFDFGSMLIIN